jgi:hypothetical protein
MNPAIFLVIVAMVANMCAVILMINQHAASVNTRAPISATVANKPNEPKDLVDLMPGVSEYELSRCGRCQRSWKWVHGHNTDIDEYRSVFPLCEECWQALTPKERLPYYRALYDSWGAYGPKFVKWEDIEAAVLAGK